MEAGRKPLARSKGLVVEALGDELLVYDTRTDRGHCLGAEAARVWKRCDGRTPADGLSAQLDLDPEQIARALDELDACELLEAPADGSTRRQLGVKVVKAGAAAAFAAPMIASVVAPQPAHAVTLAFCRGFQDDCGKCQQNGCCCCEPALTSLKDCVPDSATCCALYPSPQTKKSSGCDTRGPCTCAEIPGGCPPAPREAKLQSTSTSGPSTGAGTEVAPTTPTPGTPAPTAPTPTIPVEPAPAPPPVPIEPAP